MRVLPGNASYIGDRQQQQDAFALSDFADADFIAHGGYLALVADGIGGLQYGAEAAGIAASGFLTEYLAKSSEQTVDQALDRALDAANRAVFDAALQRDCAEQMGTTLVAALIHQDRLYWRSVGDSHLYLCRDARLSQLNADHNFARQLQRQVGEGLISQDDADTHPERKALEFFIGLELLPEVERNRQPLPLRAGDILLLCSDGIDGVLPAEEMVACLNQSPMIAAQRLCDEVLARQQPNQDNLTAVVLAYQADQPQPRQLSGRVMNIGCLRIGILSLGLVLAYLLIRQYLA
ncbi:serine/threonine-protein phosphatase [Methylomonas sp. LL1]|uniref:PP2C family protein-serine/threonine phosphatase n=1 Tax=Methylomonas sp. LL1 TaxID=2785785 RepID=UPI0018C3EB37|nr:protein phosphatase 2C domain-containing protein [Methylomonas sp. LL1]QPK63489.1 serine/threonine-protein phosphatase [Methylomonas sp. LL1]